MSDLCGRGAGKVTQKASMSIEEAALLQLFDKSLLLSFWFTQPSLEVQEGLLNYSVYQS
jgi:hypothetical protein